MEDLIVEFPEVVEQYFNRVGQQFVNEFQQAVSISGPGRTTPPMDTLTYADSFGFEVIPGDNGEPVLMIGHINPFGAEVDRLSIYWKVIEGGAAPHAPPKAKLAAWATRKFGSPVIGFAIANRIKFLGIQPQPVLSELFVFDGSFTPVDLTPLGQDIVTSELNIVREGLRRILFRRGRRAGQTQLVRIVRTPSGPRFGRI